MNPMAPPQQAPQGAPANPGAALMALLAAHGGPAPKPKQMAAPKKKKKVVAPNPNGRPDPGPGFLNKLQGIASAPMLPKGGMIAPRPTSAVGR